MYAGLLKAVKYKITAEELEELTEVLIANYNHTENAGINYLTPIDCICYTKV